MQWIIAPLGFYFIPYLGVLVHCRYSKYICALENGSIDGCGIGCAYKVWWELITDHINDN